MKDFVADFTSNGYEALACELVAKTNQYLLEHQTEIKNGLSAEIKAFTGRIIASQKQGDTPPLTYLSLSALYTSVYLQEPIMRLDIYGRQWILQEPYDSLEIKLDWLFVYWQKHQSELLDASRTIRIHFSKAQLQKNLLHSARMLFYLAAARLKYWLNDLVREEIFQGLTRDAEFYLTFGEYHHWQDVLYAELPKIDIFNCSRNESLKFRVFERCTYKNKRFEAMDLTGSRFHQCRFEHCIFTQVALNDCQFNDCQWLDTVVEDTKLLGATFTDTAIARVDFRRVLAAAAQSGVAPGDLFKETEFRRCKFTDAVFTHSQFTDCVLDECLFNKITFIDDDNNAEFRAFITAYEEGGETK